MKYIKITLVAIVLSSLLYTVIAIPFTFDAKSWHGAIKVFYIVGQLIITLAYLQAIANLRINRRK